MIPKRIFYVWGINDEKKRDVQVCIQTWRQYLPDYEIIEINENSKEYFDFQKELQNNKWFKTVYERKMYAFVADYIRVKGKILERLNKNRLITGIMKIEGIKEIVEE